jgi:hypothetical protein
LGSTADWEALHDHYKLALIEQGLLPKGPLDLGLVLEGSLRYSVLEG